ncbi:MAG: glucose-phosphate thymidylyltransferase [Crocinitomicaceae bacterium]|jgi:UDP-N-acetylglucosamine diphosphorylase/glucosamine-1-phosphate N-acetyltransferase|nr:glucose-phosphate thymidylyltransferase [Crocinitomicaceae bacterium]
MKLVLCDDGKHLKFAPLTLTRPVGDLRVGIMTNTERWDFYVPGAHMCYETEDHLYAKFPPAYKGELWINAAVIPDREVVDAALDLEEGQELVCASGWIARKGKENLEKVEYTGKVIVLENRWDIFEKNGEILEMDFRALTTRHPGQPLSSSNTVIGDPRLIFIEEGASVEASILNTKTGPIYIGKHAEVMEGAIIRGPFALCDYAGIKMGAKVYGPTTIGPHCKVGGEISNVVFQSYSNKGHDGFLGNSVIGEWCNLGADTNSSNLKNNYSKVTAYSFETESFEKTDIQFMGLIMGDHSKCGINTMFNTATVVGVSANIYGGDFPPKYIPSFSWGGAAGFEKFDKDKAIQAAKAMMGRRGVPFTTADQEIFDYLAG